MSLPQLDKNLPYTNYIDGLTYVFMDQWDIRFWKSHTGTLVLVVL
jgi:hypothetical protein